MLSGNEDTIRLANVAPFIGHDDMTHGFQVSFHVPRHTSGLGHNYVRKPLGMNAGRAYGFLYVHFM